MVHTLSGRGHSSKRSAAVLKGKTKHVTKSEKAKFATNILVEVCILRDIHTANMTRQLPGIPSKLIVQVKIAMSNLWVGSSSLYGFSVVESDGATGAEVVVLNRSIMVQIWIPGK